MLIIERVGVVGTQWRDDFLDLRCFGLRGKSCKLQAASCKLQAARQDQIAVAFEIQ
ncbi:hypothetical protein QWZ13_06365 [Reinekea marina]|uniref:hypothetical protein n=1 Tax=Reinekea marina TaxID=1310421 RepID=UPI0025B6012E|nr:hypothetical protein [Reinekea marina]MDN3648532.1 hypothetical protein [Reinekea marina]